MLQGKVETENVAKEGDMVVRADTTSKEQYILTKDAQLWLVNKLKRGHFDTVPLR